MLTEQFKPIKGYANLYEISNFGRIKSLSKEWQCGYGSNRSKPTTFCKSTIGSNGYGVIRLRKNGTKLTKAVHILVWDAFGVGQRDGHSVQVDHIDNNKLNNRIDNLQLLTPRKKHKQGQITI